MGSVVFNHLVFYSVLDWYMKIQSHFLPSITSFEVGFTNCLIQVWSWSSLRCCCGSDSWFMNWCIWKAERLRSSELSGRGGVRGCGWVTLCGRGAASADLAVIVWRGKEVIRKRQRERDLISVRKKNSGMFHSGSASHTVMLFFSLHQRSYC